MVQGGSMHLGGENTRVYALLVVLRMMKFSCLYYISNKLHLDQPYD